MLHFNHFLTNLVAKVWHWRQKLKSINFREKYVVNSTAKNWYFCLVNKILYPCFSDYVEESRWANILIGLLLLHFAFERHAAMYSLGRPPTCDLCAPEMWVPWSTVITCLPYPVWLPHCNSGPWLLLNNSYVCVCSHPSMRPSVTALSG